MFRFRSVRRAILFAAISGSTQVAFAQDRSDDNAITEAEDAFGFSVGRESIGIYSATNTRGFSPTAAGNVRIDGLYFDPAAGLQGLLIDSTSVQVGLSAQGYPFAAPSGIFDQKLRRPENQLGGSVILNGDSWGAKGIEFDGSIPVSGTLGLRVGINAGRSVYPNWTDSFNHIQTLLARWRPADNIEIIPFWSMFNDINDESGTFYVPGGSWLPTPAKVHHDEGPKWADIRATDTNAGLLTNVGLGENWVVRLGAFRSSHFAKHGFNFFMSDQQPDGTAERILIADPPTHNRSLSGELRVTHSILDGPRLHVLHVSARRRDARREFGGSDTISFGVGPVGERVTAPKPEFEFGEQTRQHVQQTTYGVAYDGRWKDVGEVSFGISRANYKKVTRIPAVEPAVGKSKPWLYNGTAAIILSKSVSLYAGYARGFEESGVAPASAANRNEPLESILTEQKDAGVRFNLTPTLRAVVGVFDLSRPYFGYDSAHIYKQVGSVRSRGAEFSVSGKLTPKLNIVFGGVLLKPRVEKSADAQGNIGSKPFGLPSHTINVNANWQTPFLKGLQLDAGLIHRGEQPSTVDNLVVLPPRLTMNAGMRYGFDLAGKKAAFRLQALNLFDKNYISTFAPGLYGAYASRQVIGYLTVDF